MAVTAPPTIDALPPPPDPNNRATYNQLAYPWSVAHGPYRTQLTAVAANVYANATDAASSASTAATQAGLATTNGAAQVTLAAAQVTIATTKAGLTAADAVATAADRVQTGLDRAAAAASAASAAAIAGAFVGTSTTNQAIAIGSKTFTTQAGEQYAAGQWVTVVSAANGANNMYGQVASYVGTTLTVNITVIGGSGSFADWNISIAGVQGPAGPAGTLSGTAVGVIDLLTGAAIPSAATVNLNAATGNRVHITGTTAITAITLTRGPRTVIFDGVLTLTHHATNNNLPGGANITTAPGDRAIYESDGVTVYCVDYVKASGMPILGASSSLIRSSRTVNAMLAAADKGTLIDITAGTFTQTFDAAATLGNGWWCYISNSGTGNITIPSSDGVSNWIMYPGEVRLFQTDGAAFRSVMLAGGTATFPTSGTFIKPPGAAWFLTEMLGAGGGGGSGSNSNAGYGAGGGGGGGYALFRISAAQVAASSTVAVGVGGTGGTATSVGNSAGSGGTAGGASTAFGFTVSGGAGGTAGTNGSAGQGGAGAAGDEFHVSAGGTPGGVNANGAAGTGHMGGGGGGGRDYQANAAPNGGGASLGGAGGGGGQGSGGGNGGNGGARKIGGISASNGGVGLAAGTFQAFCGGGGGGYSGASTGMAGGAGDVGCGGGGGSCTVAGVNGVFSGAGGAGGNGKVTISWGV